MTSELAKYLNEVFKQLGVFLNVKQENAMRFNNRDNLLQHDGAFLQK